MLTSGYGFRRQKLLPNVPILIPNQLIDRVGCLPTFEVMAARETSLHHSR
jgi:hypothetical protein